MRRQWYTVKALRDPSSPTQHRPCGSTVGTDATLAEAGGPGGQRAWARAPAPTAAFGAARAARQPPASSSPAALRSAPAPARAQTRPSGQRGRSRRFVEGATRKNAPSVKQKTAASRIGAAACTSIGSAIPASTPTHSSVRPFRPQTSRPRSSLRTCRSRPCPEGPERLRILAVRARAGQCRGQGKQPVRSAADGAQYLSGVEHAGPRLDLRHERRLQRARRRGGPRTRS